MGADELIAPGLFAEFPFHSERSWRADYAILVPTLGKRAKEARKTLQALKKNLEGGRRIEPPFPWNTGLFPIKLLVEVEGRGRHQRVKGFIEDAEKYNAACEFGFRVLRYPASSIRSSARRALVIEQLRRIVTQTPSAPWSARTLTEPLT